VPLSRYRCDGGGGPLTGGTLDWDRRRGRLGSAAEARTEAGGVGPMLGGWPAELVVEIHRRILAGGVRVGAGGGGWPAAREVGVRGRFLAEAQELGPAAGPGRLRASLGRPEAREVRAGRRRW
jgi:hypothetical protein